MKVRLFSFSILVPFLMIGMMFVGNKAFSAETNEVKPGQDFTPSVTPSGRIMMYWDQGIVGSHNGQLDPGSKKPEEGSQFSFRRLRLGLTGKILPTVTAHVNAELAGTGGVTLDAAWIDVAILGSVLKSRVGWLTTPRTKEGTSSGKFLFTDYGSSYGGENGALFGLWLYGSVLNNQFHYSFWFGNVDDTQNLRELFDKGFKERYQIGLRVQYDILRKWSHGKEWLQTKDMGGTIGVSFNYTMAPEDDGAADALIGNRMFLAVDLGFTVSLFFIQAGVNLELATAKSEALKWLPAGVTPTDKDLSHQMFLGYFVDIAITATTWFVPAIRFEGYNAKLSGAIGPSGAAGTVKGLTGFTPSKESHMNLLVVLNFYPWSAGHRFKIQPEFLYRLKHLDASGKQVAYAADAKGGKANKEYKAMRFRVGFTLNF